MPGHLVEYRASPIHGRGGFALAAIPFGTRVVEYQGERIDKLASRERCLRGNRSIFYLDADFDLDGDVDWNPARWLNHSCSPNCTAELIDGRIWIVARQTIQAGEEITFDYGYDPKNHRDHPCSCGAPNCVGFIVAEEFRSQIAIQASAR